MVYRVFMTVWGERHVAKFLQFALPTHFSPGNLGAVAAQGDVTYTIYTDRDSADALSAGIAALDPPCAVELAFFDEVEISGGTVADALAHADPKIAKHNVQRVTSHHLMARAAGEDGGAVFLLDSDFILGDGSLARARELHAAGNHVVAAMHMRLSEEAAGPALGRMLGGGATLAPRALAGLGIGALHHVDRDHFIDAADFTRYPSHVNWRVGETGFVTHCYFPHPLLVVPRARRLRYFSTLDYELALRVTPDRNAIHLCRSSDEILICKITPDAYRADEGSGTRANLEMLAKFAVDNTNLSHRLFMDRSIRFRAGGDEAAWQSAERRSTRYVEAIYKAAELIVASADAGNPRHLVYLKSFLGPIEDYMSPAVHSRLSAWIPKDIPG